MDDEGVSPVIATILMVAIAALLAAAIAVVVTSWVPGKSDDAPHVLGVRDERQDTWTVASGGFAAEDEYDIRADDAGVRYEIGAAASAASDILPTSWTGLSLPPPLSAGTAYHFCRDGGTEGFSFQIRHRATNSLIADVSFKDLAPCA